MYEKHFTLEIISPTSGQMLDVEWVEVEGVNGCFLVGPGHSPLISVMKKGNSLVYKKVGVGDSIELFVRGGIFSVEKNKAIAIVDF